MKKVTIILIGMLFSVGLFAQSTQKPYSTLLDQLAESEAEMKKPAKSDFSKDRKYERAMKKYEKRVTDPGFWYERAEILRQLIIYADENIGLNADQQTVMLLKGTPKEKLAQESQEIWKYEAYELVFDNGLVKGWTVYNPVENAYQKAMEAYNKALELDDGKYKSKIQTSLIELRNHYKNEGIMFYFAENAEQALKDYFHSIAIYEMPVMAETDTINYNIGEMYYYGAAFADGLQKSDDALELYEKLITYNNENPEREYEAIKAYRYAAVTYKNQGNLEKQEAILLEANEKFPEDKDIMVDLTQLYLDANETNKALAFLDKALEKEPDNHIYIFVRGTLYDNFKQQVYQEMDAMKTEVSEADSLKKEGKMSDKEFNAFKKKKHSEIVALWPKADKEMNKAISEYKDALKLDPNYFNAKYNIGAVYYNKAAQIIKVAELLPQSDFKSYDAEMAKAKELFEKAKPFLEEAHILEPTNIVTMQTLSTIYAKLAMYDEVKALREKIDAAKAKQGSGLK